ncbi:MAG: ATP-binding protein [Rhodoferax sp.]
MENAARSGRAGLTLLVVNQVGSAGMPDPNRVFDRYYRASGAHAKTGSGLGMYIAKGFAQKLGEELSYRSHDNSVEFQLWIPSSISSS